jgi:hypothetical protein
MNSNTFYQMRAIIVISIICCLFSSCDDGHTDPFIGTWEYKPSVAVNPTTDTLILEFKLHRQGNSYWASDVLVNGANWYTSDVENVTIEKNIGMMRFNDRKLDAIQIYNCITVDDHISVDSVLVLYGKPQKKSVYKSQFIIKGL